MVLCIAKSDPKAEKLTFSFIFIKNKIILSSVFNSFLWEFVILKIIIITARTCSDTPHKSLHAFESGAFAIALNPLKKTAWYSGPLWVDVYYSSWNSTIKFL